ncbi:hypothetical protein U5903_04255 [Cereibacter johrii]|uniref:hypothetical protein n=1 Tax=Cereibacter johrii TaxID=445629 RepID=UPI002B260A2D|nr:hypothetical protein [Cereibacter johrii]MEA5159981.1 hypothetical protein [Cereibacter johrii]
MDVLGLEDMPTCTFADGRQIPDARAIVDLLRSWAPDLIVLEHVDAMPRDGAKGGFRFGTIFGATIAACQTHSGSDRRLTLVRPKIWKDAMGLTSDKALSLAMAREVFPDASDMLTRVRDDGRAEALLLTEYHRRIVSARAEVEVY